MSQLLPRRSNFYHVERTLHGIQSEARLIQDHVKKSRATAGADEGHQWRAFRDYLKSAWATAITDCVCSPGDYQEEEDSRVKAGITFEKQFARHMRDATCRG
jgi:hypothetical protein